MNHPVSISVQRIRCEKCGAVRPPRPKISRPICQGCYNRESMVPCPQCHKRTRVRSPQTGLCTSCDPPKIPVHLLTVPIDFIICEKCGNTRNHASKTLRPICHGCYKAEPSHPCPRCGKRTKVPDSSTGFCPSCTRHTTTPSPKEILCEACGHLRSRVPGLTRRNICSPCYLREPSLPCKGCDRKLHTTNLTSGYCQRCLVKPRNRIDPSITCKCCNQKRRPYLRSAFCVSCYWKTPRESCQGCGELYRLRGDRSPLCRRCFNIEIRQHPDTIVCETCNRRRRRSAGKTRNICSWCYVKEPSYSCTQCRLPTHHPDPRTGHCPKCSQVDPASPRQRIICGVCGQYRQRMLAGSRDICGSCLKKEPTVQCGRCQRSKHFVDVTSGLCPTCVRIISRPVDTCNDCGMVQTIFEPTHRLCFPCHRKRMQRKCSERKRRAVPCSVCLNVRRSAVLRRRICQSCWRKERFGQTRCIACNQQKVLRSKSKRLCNLCYNNTGAPERLRKYCASYSSPYMSNRHFFKVVASTIDWKSVNGGIERRVRRFGSFLQTYELLEPLTWNRLMEAGEAVAEYSAFPRKAVRGFLLLLGHRLAQRKSLEPYETYLLRRQSLVPIAKAPQSVQPLLLEYSAALTARQIAPSTITAINRYLADFLIWCRQEGIASPAEVQPQTIKFFLLVLGWQDRCSRCQCYKPVSSSKTPSICSSCQTSGSMERIRRISPHTLRRHNGALRKFFAWLRLNRKVTIQPVTSALPMPDWSYRHYSDQVINRLCQFVRDPESDPAEAFALFLILSYALSAWELRHAMIPSAQSLSFCSQTTTLTQAYNIIVPSPPVTRGRRKPGRRFQRLDFPLGAQPWLSRLLDRFEHQRSACAKGPHNDYAFISNTTSRHNNPVSHSFIHQLVGRASFKACGSVCSPKVLRATAALQITDQFDSLVLTWLGWNVQSVVAHTFRSRKLVHPKLSKCP